MYAIVCLLIICGLGAGPGDAQRKNDEEKKPPQLTGAILEAHRLASKLTDANTATRTVIDKAKLWEGPLSAMVEIRGIEHDEYGGLLVLGIVTVPHPDKDRYRTPEERERIADALQAIKDLKAKHRRDNQAADDAYRQSTRYARDPGERARSYKRSMAKTKNEQKKELEELDSKLQEVIAEIKKLEEERRDACENVEVSVVIKADLEKRIDMKRLLKLARVRISVNVDKYELGYEHEEVGKHVIIRKMSLLARDVPRAVLKK